MQLEQFIDVDQFITEVDGAITDLNEAFRTQTARCAYYGIQHGRAKRQLNKVKLTIESVDAMLTKKYRQELEAAALAEVDGTNKSPLRVTADMVKAMVHVDANHLKFAQLLIEAEEIEHICKVAYNAFKTREEMLKSMGMRENAFIKGDLRQIAMQSKEEMKGGYRARREAREAEKAAPTSSTPA